MKCKISILGFFALDIKRHTQAQKKMKRKRRNKNNIDKNREECYIKSQLSKEKTNCLSVHSQFPEFFPILMVLDHKLRRDGPSSCEETASYRNRKEKYNLLAIPEHSKKKWREKNSGKS